MKTPPEPRLLAPGSLIADLIQQHGTMTICAAFMVSGGWIIYTGSLWASFVVFFSTLWAIVKLTMNMMKNQRGG
jgi:hypothetical protein